MSYPTPGWYDNTEAPGLSERYWDGRAWTGHYRRTASGPGARPNDHAVLFSSLFGAVAYAGLLVALLPRLSLDTYYAAGELLVPAGVATVLVALVARRSSRLLGWWVYAVVVPIAVVIALALSAGDLRTSAANDQSRGMEVSVLTAPAAGHGWSILDTPDTEADVRRVIAGMKDKTGTTAVAGYYVHQSAPETPVLYVGINGDLGSGTSATQSLTNLLAGASVTNPQQFEPGATGGALGCGQASSQGLSWVSCAWVGNQRAVLMRWSDTSLTLDRAAELSRKFRDLSLN